MKKQNLRILLSGFCLSSLIALVAFLFLMAEKFGSHLLWESWGHSVPFPNLYKGLLLLVVASWSLPSNESGGVCLEPAMS